MLKKEFIPIRNYVLIEREHSVSKMDLRGTDPKIPIADKQIIIAKGEDCKESTKLGAQVYMNPNPYEMLLITFEDNEDEPIDVRKRVIAEPRSNATTLDKVIIKTHVMIQERDVIALVVVDPKDHPYIKPTIPGTSKGGLILN